VPEEGQWRSDEMLKEWMQGFTNATE